MDSPKQMWLKRRGKIGFELIVLSLAGNSLMGLVIGVVASDLLRPWGWGLIGVGMVIDGLAKWRYLGGFPKKGLKTIWLERRGSLSYGLLFALMTGKALFFIGVGTFTYDLKPTDGPRQLMVERWSDLRRKIDGRWVYVLDHSTPVPEE